MIDNISMTSEKIEQKKLSYPPGTKIYKNKILGLRGKATGLVFSNFCNRHIITRDQAKSYIRREVDEMQGEYFNSYVCRQLSDYFNRRRSKLPIDIIDKNDEEYFLNRRGAKVYFDITKQPILQIAEGSQTEMVLSVGMDKSGSPLITLSNEGNPICYRLPEELSDWALMAIGMANVGENLFPSQVVFTKEKNRYFADIL